MTKLGEFFECALFSDKAYPDDMSEWPEMYRKSAVAARDKFMNEQEGRSVVEEISYCVGRDHPRFPPDLKDRTHLTHVLMLQIYLDGEPDPTYRWDEVRHDWEYAA